MMPNLMTNHATGKSTMRTTLNIDDELLAKAIELTGIREKSAIMRESLKALVERESSRRLASLGGCDPDLATIPRRQSEIV